VREYGIVPDLNDCFASATGRLTVADALERFTGGIGCVVGTETVSVRAAAGRILAENLISERNIPPADNSAVDGFLVALDDLDPDGETALPVAGRIAAGHPYNGAAKSGEALKIFTGAQVPTGEDGHTPDTIFMLEDVREEGDTVVLPAGQKRGANLRKAGEDVAVGDTVLKAGARLRAQDVGMAASLGCETMNVFKRLRVAIFSTGDEIRDPGEALETGAIYDINRYTLMPLLEGLGCAVTDLGIFSDKLEGIEAALLEAAAGHDLMITSGGVSKGEEDHVRKAVENLGDLHTWNLLIKPGRPIALGQIAAGDRHVPFIGLPGNPVAVMVTFLCIARPILLLLSGASDLTAHRYKVPAGFALTKKPGRREWLRAHLEQDGTAGPKAVKYPNDGSGILTSMVTADGLVELPEAAEQVAEGDLVDFLPFSEVFK
jgi:molybdopterin molybdotransferase